MAVRSVRVKRDDLINKIDEHVQAILDDYQAKLAKFTKDEADFTTKEAQHKIDLAAYYRRLADALDGTSKDKVSLGDRYNNSVSLYTAKGVLVSRPVPPVKPAKPNDPETSGSWEGRALDWLRQQKALLAVSVDEVISVGIHDHGILFTTPLGKLNV